MEAAELCPKSRVLKFFDILVAKNNSIQVTAFVSTR